MKGDQYFNKSFGLCLKQVFENYFENMMFFENIFNYFYFLKIIVLMWKIIENKILCIGLDFKNIWKHKNHINNIFKKY